MLKTRPLTTAEQDWYEKIRAIAVANMPYIPDIAYLFVPVMSEGLGTFACDNTGRIYLSRDGWAATWTDDECAWAFIHECLHILHLHSERLNPIVYTDIDCRLQAADIEINDSIMSIGNLRAVQGIVTSGTYQFPKNETAEKYYKRLAKKQGQGSNQSNNSGQGPGQGPNNQGCGGLQEAPESASADGSMAQGRSPQEIEAAIESAASRILDEEKNQPGSVPGGILRTAGEIVQPGKVDWVQYLASLISGATQNIIAGLTDSSFRRPSRRLAGMGDDIVLPGRRGYAAYVGVVFDTSGSMNKDDLESAIAELFKLANLPNVEINFLFYDMNSSELLTSSDCTIKSVLDKMKGGGGTDMGAGIDEIYRKMVRVKRQPHLVVVLTDGYTGWDYKSEVPVIAGLIYKGNNPPPEPPAKITSVNISY